jgi:hypothetical protein
MRHRFRAFQGFNKLDSDAIAKALQVTSKIDTDAIAKAIRLTSTNRAARLALRQHAELTKAVRWPPSAQLLETVRKQGEALKRLATEFFPPNWDGRATGEVDQILAMSQSTGLNTVWVPRLEIIRELLVAPDDAARNAVLVNREDDILEDMDSCLDGVTHTSTTEELRLARDAVSALRDGHPAAAQALAASVLSGLVHTAFAFKRFADARARFTRDDPNEVSMRQFRLTAILHTFGRALAKTDEADPGFNRHASLHAHEGHYIREHAISALLLLVGVLREVDVLLNRRDRERIGARQD